jgi:hypothetical protein
LKKHLEFMLLKDATGPYLCLLSDCTVICVLNVMHDAGAAHVQRQSTKQERIQEDLSHKPYVQLSESPFKA